MSGAAPPNLVAPGEWSSRRSDGDGGGNWTPAALEAVSPWKYRPTFLNGEPVEVIAPIDVNFVLAR